MGDFGKLHLCSLYPFCLNFLLSTFPTQGAALVLIPSPSPCNLKNSPSVWWLINFFFRRPPFLWLMFWHQAGQVYHSNSCNRLVYSATYSIYLFSETRMSLHMAHWLFHTTQKFQGSFYLGFLALCIPHCLLWYCHSCWFIFPLLTLYTVIR